MFARRLSGAESLLSLLGVEVSTGTTFCLLNTSVDGQMGLHIATAATAKAFLASRRRAFHGEGLL